MQNIIAANLIGLQFKTLLQIIRKNCLVFGSKMCLAAYLHILSQRNNYNMFLRHSFFSN